jgi:hypothetical protein
MSGDVIRKAILKVEFHGISSKDTAATKSYLEQLNTANLARYQIYFPQSSTIKYRELQNKKSLQQNLVRTIRNKEVNFKSSETIIDPLNTKGFINIRIKPPLNSRGIRRMSLPADTTVTVCGSLLPDGNSELLNEIVKVFEDVKSDFFTYSMNIPSSNPCAKILTMKSSRSDFIRRHDLIELKWEEGNKMKGNLGCAKFWSLTQESMTSALQEITESAVESEEDELDKEEKLNCANVYSSNENFWRNHDNLTTEQGHSQSTDNSISNVHNNSGIFLFFKVNFDSPPLYF